MSKKVVIIDNQVKRYFSGIREGEGFKWVGNGSDAKVFDSLEDANKAMDDHKLLYRELSIIPTGESVSNSIPDIKYEATYKDYIFACRAKFNRKPDEEQSYLDNLQIIIDNYESIHPEYKEKTMYKIVGQWYFVQDLVGKRIIVESKGYPEPNLDYTESVVLECTPNGKAVHLETRYTAPAIVLKWTDFSKLKIVAVLDKNPIIDKLKEEAIKANQPERSDPFSLFGRR